MPFKATSIRPRRLVYRQMLGNHKAALVIWTLLGFFTLAGLLMVQPPQPSPVLILFLAAVFIAYVPLLAGQEKKPRAVLSACTSGLFCLVALVLSAPSFPSLAENLRGMFRFMYPDAILIALASGFGLSLLILPWLFTLKSSIQYLRHTADEWEPISREELDALLNQSIWKMTPEQKQLWQKIRMTPEKWREPIFASEDTFWVVAALDHHVVWYNDIEEGFNLSAFTDHGLIEEYCSIPYELSEIAQKLLEKESKAPTPA